MEEDWLQLPETILTTWGSTEWKYQYKVWLYEQMVNAQPRICPGEQDTQTPMGFWDTNRSPYLSQKTRPSNNQKKTKKKQKKNLSICGLCYPDWPQSKIERKQKKDKYLDLARELKKLWNMKVTVISMVICALGTITKGIGAETEEFGNKRMSRDHPSYCIVKIGQNSEKSPGDLWRLVVSQTLIGWCEKLKKE